MIREAASGFFMMFFFFIFCSDALNTLRFQIIKTAEGTLLSYCHRLCSFVKICPGWKMRFSFWESMTCFTFYFFLFSLLFMLFVSSQFLHHPPIFASLLCFLSSFAHLRFCAHTHEHMVWRGSWHSSVRVCLSWRIYRLLFSLYLKLFCTRLHVQAGNNNRMEQCTMDAALGTRGTLLWPRAHSTLLRLFAVHVTQDRVPWIASHVKFSSRDSKIYCGLDQLPTVPGSRNNQTIHPATVFFLPCLLLIKISSALFYWHSILLFYIGFYNIGKK